jgi:multidrug efflux pump
MTSAATVFGHLMLIFVTGPGAAARNSIGWVLVVGMAIGTVFTLFAVPAFYTLIATDHRADQRLRVETPPAEAGRQAAIVH